MKTFPFGSVTAISLFAPSVKSRLKQQLKLFPTIWQLNNACRNSHFNGPTKVKKAQSVIPYSFLSIQFSSKLYATIQTVAKPLLFSVIRKERLFNSGSICFICASGLKYIHSTVLPTEKRFLGLAQQFLLLPGGSIIGFVMAQKNFGYGLE